MRTLALLTALAAIGTTAACAVDSEGAQTQATPPAVTGVVDSIFPIEEELRRFRADLPNTPTALTEVATSREALVVRFVEALARGELAELQALALDRAEFAYLYYPFTHFTEAPFELGPGLLWFQTQNRSSRGLRRMLKRLGGQPIEYLGHSCKPLPAAEDENLLWRSCEVELRLPSGEAYRDRLFGSILERHGRFKFVSYSNAL